MSASIQTENRQKGSWRRLVGFLVVVLVLGSLAAQTGFPWEEVDHLNDSSQFDAAYVLLRQAPDTSSAAFLWRMARHFFNVSDNTNAEQEITSAIHKGLTYAERALVADEYSGEAHGYYGILIGRVGEIEGTRQKIINSYAVREHTLRAIELNPDFDSWYHVMGRWHYALAELSWIERTVASIVYTAPPEATFEDAETFFMQASDLAPSDIRHLLWLGKTRIALDMVSSARASLEQAISLSVTSESDRIMQAEAKALLEDLN
ncbi:hypothetical protein ACFLZR_01575 [Candidatus Neomarinimicrobiota bacterium]